MIYPDLPVKYKQLISHLWCQTTMGVVMIYPDLPVKYKQLISHLWCQTTMGVVNEGLIMSHQK